MNNTHSELSEVNASSTDGGAANVTSVDDGASSAMEVKPENEKLYNIKVTFSDDSPNSIIENIPERYIELSSVFYSQINDIEDENADDETNSEVCIIITESIKKQFNFDSVVLLYKYIAHLDSSSEGEFIKLTIEQYYELYYDKLSDIEITFELNIEQIPLIANLAHFLDIPIIVESLSNRIGKDIKGKSAEEIREMLGLDGDLTPEQKAEIEREIEAINLIQQSE